MTGAAAFFSSPAFALPLSDGFALRLPAIESTSFFTKPSLFLVLITALVVMVFYAAFLSFFYLRERRSWKKNFEDLQRSLRVAQDHVERCSSFLITDHQLLIIFGGEEPEFEGNPGIVLETANPQRVLDFGSWLPNHDARMLEQNLLNLRSEGRAFVGQFKTLSGDIVDIEARPVTGRAMMSIRLATGERMALARVQDESKYLTSAVEQFKNVLEAIPHPFWLRDQHGQLQWVNAAYIQAVDASGADKVIQNQVEILNSEDRTLIRTKQIEQKRYGGIVTAIFAGQRRKVDVVDLADQGGGGGFALDRSELEAIQKELKGQMEAHIRTLDELPTAVVSFDHKQRLIYSNHAFSKLFALDATFLTNAPSNGEFLDHLRTQRRLPEDIDFKEWKRNLLAHYATAETSQYAWQLPDGRLLRVVVAPSPQGGITYLFDDETEGFALKTSYEGLKNTQWETLMALSEGVAVFSSDGHLQFANPAFAKMWGHEADQLEQHPHVEEIGQAARLAMGNIWRNITNFVCSLNEMRDYCEMDASTTDGRVLRITLAPLPDSATLLSGSDITDTVEAENRLRTHNDALKREAKLRIDFIKSISFELRSPLTSVVGLAQALAGGVAGALNPKQLNYTQDLNRAADAVLALTADVLDLAAAETGGVELNRDQVNLRQVLDEAMEGLKDRLGDAKVRVTIVIQENLTLIDVDSKRFRQMLFNLVANAISHSIAGDQVDVSIRREASELLLQVGDSGRGKGQDQMNLLEDHKNNTDSDEDHGLRFSLASALAKLHGGQVILQKKASGGHEIIVRLPNA